MNDGDKLVLITRYLFYEELKYKNQIQDLRHVFKLVSHSPDDLQSLYLAEHDYMLFQKFESDILSLIFKFYGGLI